MKTVFNQLPPFIQDYIYTNRWEALNDIQVAACDIIWHSDKNLLLSSPTAGGKTEAAFLPILTELYNKPSASVGILYIAPLKALINDQFVRIEELLAYADIPVTKWHGDASRAAKKRVVNRPQGVIQITPESLEAMVMKRRQEAIALFDDLRFVIIDEVHNFLGEDRGVQLSSVLERLQRLINIVPRRIGLSATLGDISAAECFINGGTGRTCATPKSANKGNRVLIEVKHFFTDKTDTGNDTWNAYINCLYRLTKGQNSIIFSNARADVEFNINRLKNLAKERGEKDVFYTHHGSIAADLREYAEEQMRTADEKTVIGATVTLELGIDMGSLDMIVQTGSPHSVSALAQRLGRSGRKTGVSRMALVFNEEKPVGNEPFYRRINWQLIKCLALIELFKTGWIEPLRVEKYPYNILLHQTLSFMAGCGETGAANLAQQMLTRDIFTHITKDDFRLLLQSMVAQKLIEKRDNLLLLGEKGERLTDSYDFYSVFETPTEYTVRENAQDIGTLYNAVPVGERFILSGKAWEVTETDKDNKVIHVKYVGGKSIVSWKHKCEGFEETTVLRKMRDILISGEMPGYLDGAAANRLNACRQAFNAVALTDDGICALSPGVYACFPWLGTKQLNALCFALSARGIAVDYEKSQWYMTVLRAESANLLLDAVNDIKNEENPDMLLPADIESMGKYGEYIPQALAKKQFADRYVDVEGMLRGLLNQQ
jgi:ATP-dependent Lhr-like helicase